MKTYLKFKRVLSRCGKDTTCLSLKKGRSVKLTIWPIKKNWICTFLNREKFSIWAFIVARSRLDCRVRWSNTYEHCPFPSSRGVDAFSSFFTRFFSLSCPLSCNFCCCFCSSTSRYSRKQCAFCILWTFSGTRRRSCIADKMLSLVHVGTYVVLNQIVAFSEIITYDPIASDFSLKSSQRW